MTRLDLIPDAEDLVAELAEITASVVAVYNHTSNDDLASVDLSSQKTTKV